LSTIVTPRSFFCERPEFLCHPFRKYDINGNGKHAQTDDEKATALLDFFTSVYTTDSDVKLELFSKSKLGSKKSIKTRNSFLIVS